MQKNIKNYNLHEVIGEGSFGTVYHATHSYISSHFAVKLVPVSKYQSNSKLHEYTDNQLKTLTKIGVSPHIIQFYELIKTQQYYYFVYEYCEGGTLMDRIRNQGRLEEEQAIEIFRQLLEAFKVLNKYNIIHRDVKPQNIFFADGRVKLGDFGFCKELGERENLTKTMIGSPIYMAPEVLKGENYNSKVDIWSLGVILYQMLYGFCPFQSRSLAMLVNNIQHHSLQFPSKVTVSSGTKKMIKRMLAKDYYRRVSWIELFGYLDSEEKLSIPKQLNNFYSFQPEPVNSFPYPQLKVGVSHSYEEKKNQEKKQVEESITSFDEKKKKTPVQKYDRNRKFYSHNYMNIIERNTTRENSENGTTVSLQKQVRNKSPRNKNSPQKQIIPSVSTAYMSFMPQHKNFEQKYDSVVKSHEKCLSILQRTCDLLEQPKESLVADAYLILSLVYKKMLGFKQQLERQDNFLEMSSTINFQLIQIDNLMGQIRYHFQQEPFSHQYISNQELRTFSLMLS